MTSHGSLSSEVVQKFKELFTEALTVAEDRLKRDMKDMLVKGFSRLETVKSIVRVGGEIKGEANLALLTEIVDKYERYLRHLKNGKFRRFFKQSEVEKRLREIQQFRDEAI